MPTLIPASRASSIALRHMRATHPNATISTPVYHFGRMGGIVPNPGEVLQALKEHFPELA